MIDRDRPLELGGTLFSDKPRYDPMTNKLSSRHHRPKTNPPETLFVADAVQPGPGVWPGPGKRTMKRSSPSRWHAKKTKNASDVAAVSMLGMIIFCIPGPGSCILILISLSLASTSCFAGFGRSGGPGGPRIGSKPTALAALDPAQQRLVLWEGVMPQRPSRDWHTKVIGQKKKRVILHYFPEENFWLRIRWICPNRSKATVLNHLHLQSLLPFSLHTCWKSLGLMAWLRPKSINCQ
jgi:hypothetical protein